MINKIIFIIFPFLYFFSSLAYAVNFKNDYIKINLNNDLISRKILKYNLKRYVGSIVINNDIRIKTKIAKSISILYNINNHLHFNTNKPYIGFVFSQGNVGHIAIMHNVFGSFSYGKNYGVIQDALNRNTGAVFFTNDSTKHDVFMFNKAKNLFSYKNKNIFGLIKGLSVKLQYQGRNRVVSKSRRRKLIKSENGHGYGSSFVYNLNNEICVSGAFFRSKRSKNQMRIDIDQFVHKYASAYSMAFKYESNNGIHLSSMAGVNYHVTPYGNVNNMYIRGLFEKGSLLRRCYFCGFADRAETFELISKYKFRSGIQASLGYFQTLARNIKEMDQYLNRFVGFGIAYCPRNNISLFCNYKLNLIKENDITKAVDIETNSYLHIGASYKF